MINDAGKHEVKSRRAITATGSIRVRCFCHDGAVATKKILACKKNFLVTRMSLKRRQRASIAREDGRQTP
jgi:hypothetical protein